jgi:predicted metal-binding membrane protein
MLVLLALGSMQVGWMIAVAAVVFVEKVLPGGPQVGRLVGFVLLGVGSAMALGFRG